MTAEAARRVVFLARVSGQHQADVGTIASQTAALRRELANRPGEVVAILEEEAVSGRTPISERKALRELEALSARQGYDELWMFNVDRASRDSDPRAYYHVFGCALDAGAVIFEVKSHYVCVPSTREGRMWWFMSAESAASAWESIRAATMSGRQRALSEGRPGSAAIAWGIHHDKARGWHFDEKAIETIRLMYQLASTPADGHPGGLPLRQIRARLEAAGIATALGGTTWAEATIARTLRNPVYKGEFRQKVPCEDRYVTFKIPAAVDAATWQAVQDALSTRSNRPTRDVYSKPALLRHMMSCGKCGSTLYFRPGKSRDKYYCRTCGTRGHPRDVVDEAVWTEVARRLENADAILAEAIDAPPEDDTPTREIAEVEALLATIKKKESSQTARWNQGLLTDEAYDSELKTYAERRRVLIKRIEAARQAQAVAEAARQQRATLSVKLQALRANIRTADFPTRRTIIETVFPPGVGRIVLHPDCRIELHGMLACQTTDGDQEPGTPGGSGGGGLGEVVKLSPGTRRQPPTTRWRPRRPRARPR